MTVENNLLSQSIVEDGKKCKKWKIGRIMFCQIFKVSLKKKSHIRETLTLSTDVDSRTNTSLKRLHDLLEEKKCGQIFLNY